MSGPSRPVVTAIVEEFAKALGQMAGTDAQVTTTQPPHGRVWAATFVAEDANAGAWTLYIDAAGAEAVTRIVSGRTDALADSEVIELLRNSLAQAAGDATARDDAGAVEFALDDLVVQELVPENTPLVASGITMEGLETPLAIGATFKAAATGEAVKKAGDRPAAEERGGSAGRGGSHGVADDRLDVILDIDLPVVVRFGRTEMTIKALTRLGPGSVIDLGRSPDDPVEVLVSNRVVATGEVVIVGGNYGIRILDVASPTERMRSMEG